MPNIIKNTTHAKLTKRFFMGLPEGVYLVSNVYEDKNTPAYADKVSPLLKREKQWRKIVEALADQRLCNVFKTKKDYLDWLKITQR